MGLEVGTEMPEVTLLTLGPDGGPVEVSLSDKLKGRKVVIFAVPGAYTGTCSTSHFPSFSRNADALRAKGVDEIICLSVNDPFVLSAWGRELGSEAAQITMLADPETKLTSAVGVAFSAPGVGLIARSQRYAIVVDDGTISHVGLEDSPGSCDISAGERILEAL